MLNSRTKGNRGERSFRDVLRASGFPAHRGRQFRGGPDSPDVVCEALPIQWEVKRTEKLRLYDALAQAKRDAKIGYYPVVAHKRNHGEWLVTLRAEDFLNIMSHSDLVRIQALND